MAVEPLHNEAEVLGRIATRDQEAFRQVYTCYHKRIYNFSLRLLRSVQLAEEVVQETFLKIWLMGEELKTVNHLEAYFVTLSRNKSLDILRRLERERRSDRKLSWSEAHNETEEAILLQDTRQLLERGILLLPAQQRLVYQLCKQEGLKYEEVALKLNISPLTVKTHMQQALRFLRTYMHNNTDLAIVALTIMTGFL